MKKIKAKKQFGFTLVEILLAVMTLAMMATVAIIIYPSFQKRVELDLYSSEIIQYLKRARTKALTGEENSNYGVNFEIEKFTLFKGNDYIPENSENEEVILPEILAISDINLTGTGTSVIFEKGTGNALNTGTVNIGIKIGDKRIITVNSIGNVEWEWEE